MLVEQNMCTMQCNAETIRCESEEPRDPCLCCVGHHLVCIAAHRNSTNLVL